MAELVLRLRDRELQRTPILHTRITLGRDAASDLVIDNVSVSRTHAVLIYVDNHFRIRDSDSQAGLLVNGKATKDCVLNYGDVIGIGKFEVVLQNSAQEPPTEPKPNRGKIGDVGIETLRPVRATKPEGLEAVAAADAAAVATPAASEAVAAAAAATAPVVRAKASGADFAIVLKIAAVVLLLILAALAGTVWALENKWISV